MLERNTHSTKTDENSQRRPKYHFLQEAHSSPCMKFVLAALEASHLVAACICRAWPMEWPHTRPTPPPRANYLLPSPNRSGGGGDGGGNSNGKDATSTRKTSTSTSHGMLYVIGRPSLYPESSFRSRVAGGGVSLPGLGKLASACFSFLSGAFDRPNEALYFFCL